MPTNSLAQQSFPQSTINLHPPRNGCIHKILLTLTCNNPAFMFLSLLVSLEPFKEYQMYINYEVSLLAKKSPNIRNAPQSNIYLIVYSLNCITHILFSNSFEPLHSSHRRSIPLSNFMNKLFKIVPQTLFFSPSNNHLKSENGPGLESSTQLPLPPGTSCFRSAETQNLQLLHSNWKVSSYYYPPHECPWFPCFGLATASRSKNTKWKSSGVTNLQILNNLYYNMVL